MENKDKVVNSVLRELADEDLDYISGGELTEVQKADYVEKVKRLKIVMNLEDFMAFYPDGGDEKVQYICSIWDQVEVPFTWYDS